MTTTYSIRKMLLAIARKDVGKVEVSKNQAPWIEKLWPATTYPDGMENREPYCAAGVAYCVSEWLALPSVRKAFGFTPEQAEQWRCKSPVAFDWLKWAKSKGLIVLSPSCILHAGDLAIYTYSHIEIVSDDDGTLTGPFTAIGYNTDAGGNRDSEGCVEKPRSRAKVKAFVRMLG